MKLLAALLLPYAFAAAAFALASDAAPTSPADLVGSWSLAPLQGGEAASGPGSITLVLRLEEGKLAGVAVIPLTDGEKRWPLIDPTFDGKTFSFRVDNGETLLAGEMTLVDGRFEGRWSSADPEDEEAGRLTMTRKAD